MFNERREIDLTGLLATAGLSGVTGAVGNLTVVDADGLGWAAVTPYDPAAGPIPGTSTLNIATVGDVVANQVMVVVPLSASNKISVFSWPSAHVIFDVTGFITNSNAPASTNGLFVVSGARPRILDQDINGTVTVPIRGHGGVPDDASAVVVNLTGQTAVGAGGFVTGWPTGSMRPEASNLNPPATGSPAASQAVIPIGTDGTISLWASTTTRLQVDVVGYLTASLPVIMPRFLGHGVSGF